MKPLNGRFALVTGASRGIGAAIAQRLAADGAEVLLHYGHSHAEAAAVARSIGQAGGKAHVLQADLAHERGPFVPMEQAARLVAGRGLDILVNNAGVAPFASTAKTAPEVFDRLAAINMRSLFFVTREAPPLSNLDPAVDRTPALARPHEHERLRSRVPSPAG